MDSKRGRDREFGLPWALGLSALLHVVLVLVAAWVPIARHEAAPAEPEDSVLRFTFLPTQDTEEVEGEVRGVVPFDVPDAESDLLAEPEPADALPAIPGIDAAEESFEPPQRETLPADVLEDAAGNGETAGREVPLDDDALLRAPEPTPERKLDAASALRDFRHAVERSIASRPPSATRGQEPAVIAERPPKLPVPGFVTGILEFESGDFDWEDYGRQVHAAILRAWYRRMYVTVGDFERWARENAWRLDDRNRIRFVIERRGDVSGIRVETPSGCPPLDDSARAALEEVILPPLPRDFPRNREVVHATFIAMVDILATARRPVFSDIDGRVRGYEGTTVRPMRRYLEAYLRLVGILSDVQEPVAGDVP